MIPLKLIPWQSDAWTRALAEAITDPRALLARLELDTVGVDVHKTTRFETYDWRHAVTYGFDAFQDKVSTEDLRGTSEVTTPGGRRTVSGGFVQWKANYTSMLEVVGDPRVGQGIAASPSRRVGEGNHAKARATKLVKRRRDVGMKWQC